MKTLKRKLSNVRLNFSWTFSSWLNTSDNKRFGVIDFVWRFLVSARTWLMNIKVTRLVGNRKQIETHSTKISQYLTRVSDPNSLWMKVEPF